MQNNKGNLAKISPVYQKVIHTRRRMPA